MNKKLLILPVLAIMSAMLLTSAYARNGPWSLFDSAVFVKVTDHPPNPWAVNLTSTWDPVHSTYTDGGVAFQSPNNKMTFADIYALGTDYKALVGGIGGGSLRFQIHVNNTVLNKEGNVFVYIGPYPNFVESPNGWETTGNLITATDNRYDTSQVGGTFYDTYTGALALVGTWKVLGISLVADSGWFFPPTNYVQQILVDNVMVNNFQLIAHGAGT